MKKFKQYIKEKEDPMITNRKKVDAKKLVPTRSGSKGGSAGGDGGSGGDGDGA
jgi:hypothetical protein